MYNIWCMYNACTMHVKCTIQCTRPQLLTSSEMLAAISKIGGGHAEDTRMCVLILACDINSYLRQRPVELSTGRPG